MNTKSTELKEGAAAAGRQRGEHLFPPPFSGPPVEVWSLIAAAALAAFYFGTSLYISSHRLLWIDEVLTVLYTRLPGWTTIWKASTEGGDGLPPFYFMAVRIFDTGFGHTDFSVRLPSALAMTAGLLLTFDCARRLTDGLHGLIALSVLTCSFLPYYGHEARSYALYFMLGALALWIWSYDKNDKRLYAVVFGAVFFLAVAMHYYALLLLVPYAAWEVWHWRPWRLPSRKMIAALLGVGCAAVVLWTPIQAGRRLYPPGYATRPSFDVLRTTFTDLFPDALFLLVLIVVCIAWAGARKRAIPLEPMPATERVGWFFFLIPIAGYFLAQMVHAFQPRYVMGTLPGVAVAFSCWLWRHEQGGARRVAVGVFLILATWGMAKQVTATRDPNRFYYSPIRQILNSEDALQNEGKRFFVVCTPARYMEAFHYSKHPEEYVLLVPPGGHNLHETIVLAQYYPMQVWTLEDLKKHVRETALLAPPEDNLNTIKQAGFHTTIRFAKPLEVVYLE